MSELPFTPREALTPEQEKLGIEFYTAGKMDGGREALRRLRADMESIEVPHEYEGYLPAGWKEAMGQVWRIVSELEESYREPGNP